MTKKIKAAIVGYGNVGRYAVDAVLASPDMELAGIVETTGTGKGSAAHKLVSTIEELEPIDVAVLCIPTRAVPEVAAELLAKGINTVDSYDIHGQLADLRLQFGQCLEFADVEEDAAAGVALLQVDAVALVGAHRAATFGAGELARGRVGSLVGLIGRWLGHGPKSGA